MEGNTFLGSPVDEIRFNQIDFSSEGARHKAYHIRSQTFRPFLGRILVSSLKKESPTYEAKKRQRNSYIELQISLSLSFLRKVFVVSLSANATGGFNLLQRLEMVQIVPRYEGIFYDVCCGNTVGVQRRFKEGKCLPNSTDIYGHSLLAMVRVSSLRFIKVYADTDKAAGNSNLEIVRYLLHLGANSQSVDESGR